MIRRVILAAVVIALAATTAGEVSPVGKRGNASSSPPSIRLNESEPHLGGTVTFAVVYPKTVKSPRVAVRCYQNGVLGYGEGGSYDHAFLLGGGWSDWKVAGGAANCTAELFYFVWNGNNQQEYYSLAWTSFDAAG